MDVNRGFNRPSRHLGIERGLCQQRWSFWTRENRAGQERGFYLSGKGKNSPKGDPEIIRADIRPTGPGCKAVSSLVSSASEGPPLQFPHARLPLPSTSEERLPQRVEGAELLPRATGVMLPPQGAWRAEHPAKNVLLKL